MLFSICCCSLEVDLVPVSINNAWHCTNSTRYRIRDASAVIALQAISLKTALHVLHGMYTLRKK
jgi:hypothetical protein